MTLSAEVTLDVDEATAAAVSGALEPEVARPVPDTTSEIRAGTDGLTIEIEADDVSSMRAALNSLLRFTHTAMTVQNPTEDP